jgi:hypothetical protein
MDHGPTYNSKAKAEIPYTISPYNITACCILLRLGCGFSFLFFVVVVVALLP